MIAFLENYGFYILIAFFVFYLLKVYKAVDKVKPYSVDKVTLTTLSEEDKKISTESTDQKKNDKPSASDPSPQRIETETPSTSEILYLNLYSESTTEEQIASVEVYYATLKNLINKTKKNLIILDYIGHCDSISQTNRNCNLNPETIAKVEELYKVYFQHIEKLAATGISYTRVIMLPALPSVYRNKMKKRKKELEDTYLKQLLFEPMKEHIEKMFALNRKQPGIFKLYFMENPIRSISEILIDEGYYITEIDLYYDSGHSIPDRLCIHSGNTPKNIEVILKEKEIIRTKLESLKPLDSMEAFNEEVRGKINEKINEMCEV